MSKSERKPSQRQKFVKAAQEHGCDENEAAFDAALKKIGTAKIASAKPRRAGTSKRP